MEREASTSNLLAHTPQPAPPALPVAQSYQDVPTSESESSSDDDQDWEAVVAFAKAAFTQEQLEEMMQVLRERGLFAFVHRYVEVEQIPIPTLLLAFGVVLPPHLLDAPGDQQRALKIACSRVLRNREKLDQYNTVDDAIQLIASSKKILVLTGAGVSTSCGIPDFRSPTGLYARLKEEHWELEDPQEMFDLTYFKEKPNVFYSFAKEIYPSNFVPSPCHRFVKLLEKNDRLLRNYTQNIDGLFESVGVQRMLNCHGSFATASCLRCRTQFPGSAIEADVFDQRVPLCPLCTAADSAAAAAAALAKPKVPEKWGGKGGAEGEETDEDEDAVGGGGEWDGKPLIKPDIVFFGEMLSDEFDRRLLEDREEVDLLIVIGTSLRVSPVSQIVSHLPHSVPQILINRDPITHANFDINLLGDGDTIVRYLCDRLGPAFDLARVQVSNAPAEIPKVDDVDAASVVPERVEDSHVWLFPGANGGRWVEAVRRAYADADGELEETDEEEQENRGRERLDGEGHGFGEEGADGKGEGDSVVGLQVPLAEVGLKSRSRTRSPELGGSADGEGPQNGGKKARVA